MPSFEKLITGYRSFKATTYQQYKEHIEHIIRQKVKPSTLFIASTSLRISPKTLTSSPPGELFIIRNFGGFVPPYTEKGANGTISAIEYAVTKLKVQNIIVLGHAHCEGIKTLMTTNFDEQNAMDPLAGWLKIMKPAKDVVKMQLKDQNLEEQEKACEQESIIVSLRNLLSYPFIQTRIDENDIDIYGWHFDIETGILMAFNPTNRFFEPIG